MRLGEQCFFNTNPASPLWKTGRKIAGLALIAAGFTGIYAGITTLLGASADRLDATFFYKGAPSTLTQPVDDPYERAFNSIRESGPQTDILYLSASADSDPKGILSPLNFHALPECIHENFKNFKYKVIRHPFQICEEIAAASQNSPLQDLVISAHGHVAATLLSATSMLKVFDPLPENCFDGLAPDARIFVAACSAGEESPWKPNIAEWISWLSGKEVVAPTQLLAIKDCSILPITKRLDVSYYYSRWEINDPSMGESFHIAALPLLGKVFFAAKFLPPAALGTLALWQTARLGATVLQGSGRTIVWLADQADKRKLCQRTAARHLLTASKGAGKLLAISGQSIHASMDTLVRPLTNAGSWTLNKSKAAVLSGTSAASGLCRKTWQVCRRILSRKNPRS